MMIQFYASHLLHHRSLIPVMCELSSRGHEIVVQTTRPDWMGLPRLAMEFAPQRVCGVNMPLLDWLARKTGYGYEWWMEIEKCRSGRRMEGDVYVSTTKDIAWLQDRLHSTGCPCFAVGYQHFPVIIRLHRGPVFSQDVPDIFTANHPFGRLHNFLPMYFTGDVQTCGFPHLDPVISRRSPWTIRTVQLQHHGGFRGLKGHDWMRDIAEVVWKSGRGFTFVVSPHWVPGIGYGGKAIRRALRGGGPYRLVPSWWPYAKSADLVLTTGSASMYEFWSVSIQNAMVLTYLGGGRHEHFQMFKDLLIESPEALRRLLDGLPASAQTTEPLTREVTQAFRDVHDGRGAKTAADVIEGKL